MMFEFICCDEMLVNTGLTATQSAVPHFNDKMSGEEGPDPGPAQCKQGITNINVFAILFPTTFARVGLSLDR